MKKFTFAIAAAALLASQAFAQSAPGPADGSSKTPQLPAGSAAKPGGVGDGNAMGAAKPASPSKAERKAAGQERRAKMKAANKGGEIPAPSVQPKSY
ncbi:hypothetical protein GT347_26415 [Xylophilus rhododendri]|uniref:Uncharacterized protein n=1 Tax=Xylophilus rhododendri TaxID=2697032 RepID=A0A857JB19_9BURK|nr:hypothetical protein [Xylophilus rhododendri]QHJ01211.1 hypothetical protein GT347_26415 [Xylophilus rhododendri]